MQPMETDRETETRRADGLPINTGKINSSSTQDDRNTYLEYSLIGPLIRLYANAPLVASLGNAISIVNLVGQSAATFKLDNYSNDDGDDCYDGSQNLGPGSLYYICPYIAAYQFQTFIILMCCYYGLLIIVKIIFLLRYSTDDLRFYLACDCINSTRSNILLHIIGVLLTISCGFYGILLVTESGNTSTIGTILSFVLVNCYALYVGTKTHYQGLQGITFQDDIFQTPIYHVHVSESNSILQKITRSHYELIDAMMRDAFINLDKEATIDKKLREVFYKVARGKIDDKK